jgi:hypothetical protein
MAPKNTVLVDTIPQYTSYDNYFYEWKKKIQEDEENEYRTEKIHKRDSFILDPPCLNNLLAGEERFRQFEDLLENGTSWKRHTFQKEFHQQAAMVLAPNIIGEDWDTIGPVLIKERKWGAQRSSKILLGVGPRRFGKSIAQALLAFSYSLTVPNSKQAIFSTSERISKYMGELIYKCFCDAGLKYRVLKFGEEHMIISGDGSLEEDKRTIYYVIHLIGKIFTYLVSI